MNYDINKDTGFFEHEYVTVVGVPFSWIPHTEGTEVYDPPKPNVSIEVLKERSQYEISWPNVIKLEYVFRQKLTLDVNDVPFLDLNTPTKIVIGPALEEGIDVYRGEKIELEDSTRDQALIIKDENTMKILPVLDTRHKTRSTSNMPTWYTRRKTYATRKTQINRCAYDSSWEESTAKKLDDNEKVKAWAKNDHLGFSIDYIYEGRLARYLPDFLIRLENDKMLIVKVKGGESEQDRLKHKVLDEWVKAVNNVKIFGEWDYSISMNPNPNEIDWLIEKALRKQKRP